MKTLALLAVILTLPLGGQTVPATATSELLAPIAWMAGGTWHGEVTGPDGKPTKIDTRVERELAGKAFTFSTKFDGVEQYRGFFSYDAAKKSIVFAYPSADGGIAAGTVAQSADSLLWDFTMTEANGSVGHFQVHTRQTGADDYTWALFQPQGDAWSKLFEIHYHRIKD